MTYTNSSCLPSFHAEVNTGVGGRHKGYDTPPSVVRPTKDEIHYSGSFTLVSGSASSSNQCYDTVGSATE